MRHTRGHVAHKRISPYVEVSRRWQNLPERLLPLSQAISKARGEWSSNFDNCTGAFVSESVYLKSRVFLLACEKLSDSQLADIITGRNERQS